MFLKLKTLLKKQIKKTSLHTINLFSCHLDALHKRKQEIVLNGTEVWVNGFILFEQF